MAQLGAESPWGLSLSVTHGAERAARPCLCPALRGYRVTAARHRAQPVSTQTCSHCAHLPLLPQLKQGKLGGDSLALTEIETETCLGLD